jgi:HEAT repeat protein
VTDVTAGLIRRSLSERPARRAAVSALQHSTDPMIVNCLIRLAETDSDVWIRALSLGFLQKVCDDPHVQETFWKVLTSAKEPTLVAAAVGGVRLKSREGRERGDVVAELIRRLGEHRDTATRVAIVQSLRWGGEAAEQALRELPR